MKYPKLRELKEAIRALIRGPYTSKFPKEPHVPYERFRGRPDFHDEDCIGCGACVEVCPAKALEMADNNGKRVLTVHWDLCIFCGNCQANCLTGKGIVLSREFDLATTGKRQDLAQSIEKEMIVCTSCGEAIVPQAQFLWVAQRLGALVFSNVSLLLAYVGNLGLFEQGKAPSLKAEDATRGDRFKILCPRCRRQAVLKS